jgi:hypothetical protein
VGEAVLFLQEIPVLSGRMMVTMFATSRKRQLSAYMLIHRR